MENVKAYEGKWTGTNVTLKVLSSASYSDCFIKTDEVLGAIDPFLGNRCQVIAESRPAVSIRLATDSDRAFLQQIAERLADFDLPRNRAPRRRVAEADRSALNKALDHPISGTEFSSRRSVVS